MLILWPYPGKAVSYARIGLNSRFHIQESMLKATLAFVIGMDMDSI